MTTADALQMNIFFDLLAVADQCTARWTFIFDDLDLVNVNDPNVLFRIDYRFPTGMATDSYSQSVVTIRPVIN